jgi:hypothetical protein
MPTPASGTVFGDFINYLVELGIADVILPFILIFTLVYAILTRTKILGEGKKNFNVMIALVIALSVVIPHITGSYRGVDIVNVINSALPNVSVWIVLFISFLLLIGVFGITVKEDSTLMGFLGVACLIIVLIIFASSAGWIDPKILAMLGLNNPKTQAFIIIIAVFVFIIWFVTKEPPKSTGEKMGDTIKSWFNKVQ